MRLCLGGWALLTQIAPISTWLRMAVVNRFLIVCVVLSLFLDTAAIFNPAYIGSSFAVVIRTLLKYTVLSGQLSVLLLR